MNRLLLLVGSLMLLALTTALIAPRFIDWSNYTDIIEEQASRVLGRQVHVSGDVDLRFLPNPRIVFSDVEIASSADGAQPELTVRRIDVLMALAPFLSGETHILELTLDTPVVRLSPVDRVQQRTVSDAIDLGTIRVDEATIFDGRLERMAADGSVQPLVDGLNASLSAPSLLGPWRVDPATAIIAGEPVKVRASTGSYAGDRRMRMRVAVLPVDRPLEVTVDGHLDWAEDSARFDGRGLARSLDAAVPQEGQTPVTWRVGADVLASLDRLEAEAIELTLGQAGDQAFALNGRAHMNLGARPAFNAEMSSRQVDLDRMFGGGAAEPIEIADGLDAAGSLVRWIDQMTVPGQVSFDIPAIVIGGSVVRDIGFNATYRPGLPLSLDNLVGTFPGETEITFTGAVGAVGRVDGNELALDGVMSLESRAPDTFVGWSTGRRGEGATFSQLSTVSLSGRLVAAPEEVSLERLRGSVDGAGLEGAMIYREIAGLGTELDVDLNAGRFDFGLLAGLGRWITQIPQASDGGNLIDTLSAELSIAELVAGPEDLGEVSVSVAATPQRIRIDQLSIGDAAGASVSANGFFDRGVFPPVGEVTFNADMERLGGLVRLGRDVLGDHPLLVDLSRNARLYEPAAVSGSYSHEAAQGLQLSLAGTLGQTDIDLLGSMPPHEGADVLPDGLAGLFGRPAEMRFEANALDAFALIGQLGVPALPIDTQSSGTAFVTLASDGESPPQVRAAFDGLDIALRLDAALVGSQDDGVAGLEGTGSVFVGDVAQVGLMAGMAVPGLFDPMTASAGFDVAYDHAAETASFSNVIGSFADVFITGSGEVAYGASQTSVLLDLDAEQVDLRQLMAGFLGPSTFDAGFSENWPEGPILFNPVPVDLRLSLASPRVQLWDDLTARDAVVVVQAHNDTVTLDELSGDLLGGSLEGRLALRNAEQGTLAQGRLAMNDLDMARFAWERAGQPIVRGDLSANMSFESAGSSLAALIASSTGEGTLALRDVTVSGLGLNGFSTILQASDAGLLSEDAAEPFDLEASFAEALLAGSMRIEEADTPVSLVGGVAQLSNFYLDGPATTLRGGLRLNLADNALDANFSYTATGGPGDVEAMPAVGLSFVGPLASPQRELDVAQLESFLSVRALELEIERVEALNAEIIERERLLRIMAAVELDQDRIAFERAEARRLEQDIQAERDREAAAVRAREAAQENALREALEARQREQQLLTTAPSALDLSVPGLRVPTNALQLGENPPPATSAPLDLSPR